MRTTTIGLHGYEFTVSYDEDGIEQVELELTAEQRADMESEYPLVWCGDILTVLVEQDVKGIEDTARASLDRDPTPVYGWQQSRPGPMGVLPAGW